MELRHNVHTLVHETKWNFAAKILCNGYCIGTVEAVSFPWNKWGHFIRAVGKYELPFWLMRRQSHLSVCLSFWKGIRALIKISGWDFVDKFVTGPGPHQFDELLKGVKIVAAWDDMTMPWICLWSEEVWPGKEHSQDSEICETKIPAI